MVRKFTFTLTVAESKRLIAQGVMQLPSVKKALQDNYLILAHGTGNAYIYEELTGKTIDKCSYAAGVTTNGVACVTSSATRMPALVLHQGKTHNRSWQDVLADFTAEDLFIKGANCFDLEGNIGILLGGKGGGTIGKAYGTLKQVGSTMLVPVGLEKLIPSVVNAAKNMGQTSIDASIGLKCGLYMISDALIFTEVEALQTLFEIEAIPIAAGGVDDCNGSISLLVKGNDQAIDDCHRYIKSIKGEPKLNGTKRPCIKCQNQCSSVKKE